MTSAPLAGLRVLDAASLYAGPLISSFLADHGADVVRLEPPGGDPYRAFPTRLWGLTGRHKRSLVLDLDTDHDRALLHGIIPAADVVVVNEPAARLSRRGLDHATLSRLNPGLIYVHLSGYGLDGPAAARPGNGTLGEAYAGLTHMTGEPDGPPVLPSVPLGDAVTALTGAFGVLVACYHKLAHGGPGCVVDVNPVDAMLHVTAPVLTAYDGTDVPTRAGSELPGAPLRTVVACADDRWFAISLPTRRHQAAVAALVAPDRPADADDDLAPYLRRWAATRDRAEVLKALDDARVPVAPVHDAQDLVEDDHLRARHAVRTLIWPGADPVRVPAPAPRLSECPEGGPNRLPAVGEHTGEVLREWGR